MANEPYKDITWMRFHYVQKRMNLKDIKKVLEEKHNVSVTVQTLFNWAEKYDLLKYRGKGRKLKAGTRRIPKSPMQIRVEKERNARRRMNNVAKRAAAKKRK